MGKKEHVALLVHALYNSIRSRDCVRCNVEMEYEKTEHPANENQLSNERVRGRDTERGRQSMKARKEMAKVKTLCSEFGICGYCLQSIISIIVSIDRFFA